MLTVKWGSVFVQLVVSDDGTFLTGELGGTIVDGERKVALMEGIASTENIALQQVVAIGDGANDVPMLQRAGLGVAFNAKPLVQLEVDWFFFFFFSFSFSFRLCLTSVFQKEKKKLSFGTIRKKNLPLTCISFPSTSSLSLVSCFLRPLPFIPFIAIQLMFSLPESRKIRYSNQKKYINTMK